MSKFSEMRERIEPIAVMTAESIPVSGSPRELESLLRATHISQVKAGQDLHLTLATALACRAIVDKWLELFEAECDLAEAGD